MDETNNYVNETVQNTPQYYPQNMQTNPQYDPMSQYGADNQMVVSENTREKMSSMGGWMKFLGIVGIIIGLIVIGLAIYLLVESVSAQIGMPGLGNYGMFMGFLYIIIGGIAIYLAFMLYAAGKKFKGAAESNDSNQLDEAVSNQHTYFSCSGMLVIAYFVLLVILLIVIPMFA